MATGTATALECTIAHYFLLSTCCHPAPVNFVLFGFCVDGLDICCVGTRTVDQPATQLPSKPNLAAAAAAVRTLGSRAAQQ